MRNPFGRNLAIDIGTANTVIYQSNNGIVLNEPSIVCVNTDTGEILSVGHEARKMVGRTPAHIVSIKPLKDGVVADFETAQKMLRMFLTQVGVRKFISKPIVVVAVPPVVTSVEHRAIKDAAYAAGAKKVYIMEEPMAAAIGAELPIDEPVGNMIIDIGGGTSETAVISLGGVVALEAIRVGSFDIDAAIQTYVRREHGIAIGERTAEDIKIQIGTATPMPNERGAQVRGRDLVTGLPKNIMLTPEEVRFAIDEVVSQIVNSVTRCLSKVPPEMAQDFLQRGMYLVGGGGLLRGLAQRIEKETDVPVRMSPMPLEAVVLGAGHCVENYQVLRSMFMGARR